MKLIHIAKRRPDGLIDREWVEGFEAFQAQSPSHTCPYAHDTEEFRSWFEGWRDGDNAHSSRASDLLLKSSSGWCRLVERLNIC